MFNLLKLRSKQSGSEIHVIKNEGDYIGKPKHYPSHDQEWVNSIYSYNKNTTKLLPTADDVVAKLIKGYFHMYSKRLEKKANFSRIRVWMRRLSTRKIIVSNPTFKHTNDKVVITLFIYNREYTYYLSKLRNIMVIQLNRLFNLSTYGGLNNNKIVENHLKKRTLSYNKRFRSITNKLKTLHSSFLSRVISLVKFPFDIKINSVLKSNLYKSYVNKIMEKEILFMYIKQLIFFNNYKFKDTYITPLKNLIEVIYGKKVEFNLITLKNYYFNSSIYTQVIALKTRNRKNKVLRVLKSSLRNVNIPNINKELIINNNDLKIKQNVIISTVKVNELNNDYTGVVLNNNFNPIKNNKNIINDLKYKHVIGIRIETSGRLTKRMTAARSLFKVKYKGTLKNIDSSYRGISSLMLRGNNKSNIQYTKLNSKSRVGSFGVKGWISSN